MRFSKIKSIKKDKIILCRYNNTKANKTITSILRSLLSEGVAKTVNGSHSVFVYDFIGYTTWYGRLSFSPVDILPRAFVGYERLTI